MPHEDLMKPVETSRVPEASKAPIYEYQADDGRSFNMNFTSPKLEEQDGKKPVSQGGQYDCFLKIV
jgi:hypothetical protein